MRDHEGGDGHVVAELRAPAAEGVALPIGPLVLVVHMASVWVPFTSEAKEAIAGYDEILKEIRLALQECGRRVGVHVHKNRRAADEARKREPHRDVPARTSASRSSRSSSSRTPERDKTCVDLKAILDEAAQGVTWQPQEVREAHGGEEAGEGDRRHAHAGTRSCRDELVDRAASPSVARRDPRGRSAKRGKPAPRLPRALARATSVYDEKQGYFEIGAPEGRAHAHRQHGEDASRRRCAFMALSQGDGREQRLRDEAGGVLPVARTGARRRFDEQTESDTVMDDIEALFSTRRRLARAAALLPRGARRLGRRRAVVHRPRPGDGRRRSRSTARASARAPTRSRSRRAPALRDRREVHPRDRDRRHVPAAQQPQVLEDGELHPGRDGRRADARDAPVHPAPLRRAGSIPVYAFVDCDPYGIANIYRTLKVGSGNAAHINRFFCVPQAQLPRRDAAGHPRLQAAGRDAQAARRRRQAREGRAQERPVLPGAQAVGRRRSSRCCRWACAPSSRRFAKWGLNYVIEEYLPREAHEPRRSSCREGHRPRRRLRHAALPRDARRVEAAPARLRQADGLLPAQHADARGHPRPARDLDARGHAGVPAPARRRILDRRLDLLRRAAEARGHRAGVPDREGLDRRRGRRARARRQHLLRPRPPGDAAARRRAARRARPSSGTGSATRSATASSTSTATGKALSHRGEAGEAAGRTGR